MTLELQQNQLTTYKNYNRTDFTRHVCGACGQKKYTDLMVQYPVPNNNTETTFFCKGRYMNSGCETKGVQMLYDRRNFLKAELEKVTLAIKQLRQTEIR